MITIVSVNKKGNRIYSYNCTDGNSMRELTKREVIEQIKNNNVSNGKIQKVNGRETVRITKVNKADKGNGINIIDYIIKARKSGATRLSLNGLVVDTDSMNIIVMNGEDCTINDTVNHSKDNDNLDELLSAKQMQINNTNEANLFKEYTEIKSKVEWIQYNKDRVQKAINSAIKIEEFYKKINSKRYSKIHTDSWAHRFGLFTNKTIGCAAGGACGRYDFYTNGVEVSYLTDKCGKIITFEEFKQIYPENANYNASYNWIINHLKSFKNDLAELEEKLKAEIEEIKNM